MADCPRASSAQGRAGCKRLKRHAPATQRNREPIAELLARELPEKGRVLEVASGSGEHAVFFAGEFPGFEWHPSDPDDAALESIAAWTEESGLPNIARPIFLDASAVDWSIDRADAVLCCNMIHISPWEATVGLFRGSSQLLGKGAPLVLYGPFVEPGVETAPSNLAFDQGLKVRNPKWGLRSLEAIDALAASQGFDRTLRRNMPANNLTLIYRKI